MSIEANNIPCSARDSASGGVIASRSVKMSVLVAIRAQRLGHDTYVGDAGLLHGVHHRGEGAEGNVFIRAYKDVLILGIANLVPEFVADLIDVDGIVAKKDALLFIDRNH